MSLLSVEDTLRGYFKFIKQFECRGPMLIINGSIDTMYISELSIDKECAYCFPVDTYHCRTNYVLNKQKVCTRLTHVGLYFTCLGFNTFRIVVTVKTWFVLKKITSAHFDTQNTISRKLLISDKHAMAFVEFWRLGPDTADTLCWRKYTTPFVLSITATTLP